MNKGVFLNESIKSELARSIDHPWNYTGHLRFEL